MKVFSYISLCFVLLFISCSTTKKLVDQNFVESSFDFDLDGVPDDKDACPKESGSPFNLGCPNDRDILSKGNSVLSTDYDLDGIPDDKD